MRSWRSPSFDTTLAGSCVSSWSRRVFICCSSLSRSIRSCRSVRRPAFSVLIRSASRVRCSSVSSAPKPGGSEPPRCWYFVISWPICWLVVACCCSSFSYSTAISESEVTCASDALATSGSGGGGGSAGLSAALLQPTAKAIAASVSPNRRALRPHIIGSSFVVCRSRLVGGCDRRGVDDGRSRQRRPGLDALPDHVGDALGVGGADTGLAQLARLLQRLLVLDAGLA